MSKDDDAPLMAEPPPQSNLKPQNPNWGGRREGSGRKKNTLMTELPELARVENTEISRMYHYSCFFLIFSSLSKPTAPIPSQHPTPARGFFAPRNRFQDPSSALHPTTVTTQISDATDQVQGATNQENGMYIVLSLFHRLIN